MGRATPLHHKCLLSALKHIRSDLLGNTEITDFYNGSISLLLVVKVWSMEQYICQFNIRMYNAMIMNCLKPL